ncbi:hypothetical protein YC2023_051561 [Brassica napus]
MDYVNDKEVGTGAGLLRIRDQTVDEQAKDPPFDQDMGDATTSEEPLFIDQFYSNLLSISNVDASNDAAVYRIRDICGSAQLSVQIGMLKLTRCDE